MQEQIDELLVALGRQGLEVVRLKGGDPYVFGRGGEEALALAEAGIPFEVVPGISSIAAVPAAAGIPVTHRGVSDRVTIATAHAADGSPPDYASLAAAGGTLVLFMGLARLRELADGLDPRGDGRRHARRGGLARHVPDQEVATATLDEIADVAGGAPGPALVVDRRRRRRCPRPAVGLRPARLGGPASRTRRMPRTAWRIRCSFSTSAKRTKPSPPGPKPDPGETATLPSRARCSAKASEPIAGERAPGTGAQANIVPRGLGNDQPARSRPSQSASRRER